MALFMFIVAHKATKGEYRKNTRPAEFLSAIFTAKLANVSLPASFKFY